MAANTALVLKISRTSQAGLSTTFNVSDSSYMELITRMLDSLKYGAYDDMTNDELYDLVLEKRYNVLFSNCLLLLIKIINFEDRGGDRLQDKGFAQLRQREERDVRDLRRNVEKRCDEFLRSLRAAGAPFQVDRGGKGLFTSAGLDKSLLPLGPFTHQSGFHYNLRLSFLNLVHVLNGAYTYQGRDVYDIDRNELARAFRLAAGHLEWALAQHAAGTRRRVPEEDLAISSQFNLLTINSNSQQTKYAGRPAFSQTRTAPASSAYPQSPPFTPSWRPTAATAPPLSWAAPPPSWAAARSSPPAAPRFGVVSPIHSPQAASSSQYRSAPTCTKCKQTGHSSPNRPKTQCYLRKYPRTEDGSVMLLFYRTTITAGQRELTLCFLKHLGEGFGHMGFDCPVYTSTPQRRR